MSTPFPPLLLNADLALPLVSNYLVLQPLLPLHFEGGCKGDVWLLEPIERAALRHLLSQLIRCQQRGYVSLHCLSGCGGLVREVVKLCCLHCMNSMNGQRCLFAACGFIAPLSCGSTRATMTPQRLLAIGCWQYAHVCMAAHLTPAHPTTFSLPPALMALTLCTCKHRPLCCADRCA